MAAKKTYVIKTSGNPDGIEVEADEIRKEGVYTLLYADGQLAGQFVNVTDLYAKPKS